MPAGYYSGGQVNTDANLETGNIRSGVSIFGVSGNPNVVDTTEATAPAAAANIMSGKKAWVNGTLVTGTMTGFTCTTGDLSPLGRWCDQGNGTVKDMTTGFVWLQDAGCAGRMQFDTATAWAPSFSSTNKGNCSTLNDGSTGNWFLPSPLDLKSLVTGTEAVTPGTSCYFFSNVQGDLYWSGSSRGTGNAWNVYMVNGSVFNIDKINYHYVWPVRSGQ